MHKKELVKKIADRTAGSAGDPLTKSDVEEVIDGFCEVVTQELAGGGKVQITGFGSFSTTRRNPTNPQTGLKIGERQVAKFKVGADLKERVQAGGERLG